MNDNEKEFNEVCSQWWTILIVPVNSTRDKRHAGQSIIASIIESSPPPTDFDFLLCYTIIQYIYKNYLVVMKSV